MSSCLSLQPTTQSVRKAKRPRPISKKAFIFGIGSSLYAIAGLMDLISYWSNVNDEEDDEFNSDWQENATPMAAVAAFCYIVLAVLCISATPSQRVYNKSRKNPWWQTLLEDQLQVRAEFTLQVFFLMGSILLFAAEELKTHKLMRSLRKQQRTSQYCFVLSLHLFWLSTYGLYKIVPTESDVAKEKTAEDEGGPMIMDASMSESSLEKYGRLFLITGTTMELAVIYIEYWSEAKVSTGTILLTTFVSALCWWTNALLVVLRERYYYSDLLDNEQQDDKIVDFSFEDAMNLPDRLRQRLQAHRRHVTQIRVV